MPSGTDSNKMGESGMRWDRFRPLNRSFSPMFLGEYRHAVDEKGRLSIPAKFRARLEEGAVVTRGLDGCLTLYPLAEWKVLAERLANLPISQSDARAFSRLLLAGAMEAEIDRAGRVMIPSYLRSYASLKKEVVVAGLYNRIEIWDQDTWTKVSEGTASRGPEIAERLGGIGI